MSFEFSFGGFEIELAGGFFIGVLVFVILIYVVMSLLLSSLHRMIYGSGTILAWLPITSTYILGKVTISPIVGWLLIAFGVLQVFAPFEYGELISSLYVFANFGLYVYAIIKFFVFKHNDHKSSAEIESFINSQPMYNSGQAFQQQNMNYQQQNNYNGYNPNGGNV
jgi:hypothetical protein